MGAEASYPQETKQPLIKDVHPSPVPHPLSVIPCPISHLAFNPKLSISNAISSPLALSDVRLVFPSQSH